MLRGDDDMRKGKVVLGALAALMLVVVPPTQSEALTYYVNRLIVDTHGENPDIWGWHRYDGFEEEPFLAHLFSPLGHNVTRDVSLVGNFNWQVNANNFVKTGFEFHYNTYDVYL